MTKYTEVLERRVAVDIGSGQIKMQVADIDLTTNKIVDVVLIDAVFVKLREDLAQSQDGRLSADIQNQAVNAIWELVKKAEPFCPNAYHAIATEPLRLAKNGDQLAARITNETGVPVTVISQEEEGVLGFLSAVSETNVDSDQVIAWDFGAGSFQITAKCGEHYSVYRGTLGRIPFKTALLKIQGKEGSQAFSPNPIAKEHVVQTITFIKENIQEVPEPILQKLHLADTVVLGVGIHPLWGMPQNDIFDRNRVFSELDCRLNLDDDAIRVRDAISEEQREAAVYVVSNLLLAYGIMEALGIHRVHYVGTLGANAIGTLLSPKYWQLSNTP